jgi:ATP-dependent RNA helicase DDX19/DBP5
MSTPALDAGFDVQKLQATLDETNTEHEVEVTLAEADHLYQSASSFEHLNLSKELLLGIYGMGFQKPSKIQAKALPMMLASPPTNLIAQSQSGTGKTAGYILLVLL